MKNFHFTTRDLARGGKPRSREDLQFLKNEGIRTIVSLQEGWSDFFRLYDIKDEKRDWEAMGGKFYQHRLSNWFAPTQDETDAVLRSICAQDGKTYLHCYSGVDRTGWIAAAYKVLVMGNVTPEDAWKTEAWAKGTHKWFFWWRAKFLAMFSLKP